MVETVDLSAKEIARRVRGGGLSAVRVTEQALKRIAKKNPAIGAFLSVDEPGALARAAAIDAQVKAGEDPGILAGVPVGVKDNICLAGQTTTCASKMLENYQPPYSATVVEKLMQAGAVIVGKCNLDEFAMGSSTENSALLQTRNPCDPERVPGGSSGGSAAAVASKMVPLALGSDTGGSIRQPGAYCGVLGMKPTYGAVSRYGLIAFGSSLDQIGPFARTAADAALLLEAISGRDERDATSASESLGALTDLTPNVKGVKIGLLRDYWEMAGLEAEVKELGLAAVARLKAAGAEICDVTLPHAKYAAPTYYIVATAEASSNLARYDGAHYGLRDSAATDIINMTSRSRALGFGAEVKRRIMLGTYVLSAGYYDAYYLRGLKVRTLIARDFAEAFRQVDIIAAPVTPTAAFKAGEKTGEPLAMYLSDIFTIGANLAGVPALSAPCGQTAANLPVGLQLIGPHFADGALLNVAAALKNPR